MVIVFAERGADVVIAGREADACHELAEEVRATDISRAWDLETSHKNAKTNIPLQRCGEADEIVGAALYLVSDGSSYTTGAIIKIDGGAVWSS
jgi:NAD(P)-dependent dehydrogenase (short-subunit alcohol dehydrogenase family)